MSTSKGSGGGGVQTTIPAGSRKVVQSLKEIVNCSEAEIYSTLKECDMDPNEAINRLLSQVVDEDLLLHWKGSFPRGEKQTRKEKEVKDYSESRVRGANNSSTRHKNGSDRQLGSGTSAPYNASDSPLHGKSRYKKENGSTPYTSHLSSGPGIPENDRSDGASAESKGSLLGTADGMPCLAQPASGYQSAWVCTPGQVSMADIVRNGRPYNKTSNVPNASHCNVQDPSATDSLHDLRLHADHALKSHQSEVSSVQQDPTTDEWPSIEKAAPADVISVAEYTVVSEQHPEASDGPSDSNNHHYDAEEVQEREDDNIKSSLQNHLGSVPISSRKIPENDSRGALLFENELYNNIASYHSGDPDFEHHEDKEVVVSVSSVSRNLQQLSVENDGGFPCESNTPIVVIPDHLQIQAADCSHLSFGSFGAGMSAPCSSGTMAPAPLKTNLEVRHNESDNSSAIHVDTRDSEYYINDSLRDAPDNSLFHRNGSNVASVGSYDASSASQPEELKPESAEVADDNQYPLPSSNPGYTLNDVGRLNAAFSETNSQMQNLATFSNVMQSYTNSLPSTLLPGNSDPSRESDLQYSQFPVSHSMPTKYGNSISAVGISAISMPEALKTAGLSSAQPAPQSLPGTSVATGPPLPQHIAMHPYSQPTLPLGPFANMIGYPFLPQNYTYMPSAFQQSFAGNNTYHQSLAAALLPQYKTSASVSSLPQSAAVPSGYGAFGSSSTVPGNYPMPAAHSGSTLSYDKVLSSQYKENNQLLSLQKNENPAMWLHGHSSRTAQAVPSSMYYNYQGQNQEPRGFRQGQQQPPQNYGAPGYPNFYLSQTGILLDQQQNPRDGLLVGAQGQPKHSQIWPNSY